jgi:peptide deformylase
MRKIILYPNNILRQETKELKEVDKITKKGIADLKKILEVGENAAGLAATQIGVSKRFFGIKQRNGEVEIYINPKLLKTFGKRVYPMIERPASAKASAGKEDFLEGCLSFPNYFGTVKRYLEIEIEWQEWRGEKFVTKKRKLSDFEAIVWQHENDHLWGKLFVDYIKKEGGKFYKQMGAEMVEWEVKKIL